MEKNQLTLWNSLSPRQPTELYVSNLETAVEQEDLVLPTETQEMRALRAGLRKKAASSSRAGRVDRNQLTLRNQHSS